MRIASVVFLMTMCVGSQRVHAQDGAQAQTPAAQTEQVRALFQNGLSHYNLHEYAEAIEAFKEGYRLSRAPGFLFNLAQAYRMMGNCGEALRYYESDVRLEPNAPYRHEADRHIEAMRECVANQQRTTPMVAPTITSQPERPPIVDPSEAHPGRLKRVTGLAIAGVGLALVGTGVYFSVQAHTKSDQCTSSDPCLARDVPALDAEGDRAERRAAIGYAIGGAMVATGAVLYYLGLGDGKSTPSVALVPRSGGIAATWARGF